MAKRLKKSVRERALADNALLYELCQVFEITHWTLKQWLKKNVIALTAYDALEVISERLKLDKAMLLEDVTE